MNAVALNWPREFPGEQLDYRAASLQRESANNISSKLSDVAGHSFSPSLPNKHGVEDMGEAIGEKRRNSGVSYEERVKTRTSLHVRLVEHVKEPTKDVLRKVPSVSADSIDAYRQKNVPQSWAQMIAFGRAYPGFALDVMELMGLDIDRDRQAYALFLTLQRQMKGD